LAHFPGFARGFQKWKKCQQCQNSLAATFPLDEIASPRLVPSEGEEEESVTPPGELTGRGKKSGIGTGWAWVEGGGGSIHRPILDPPRMAKHFPLCFVLSVQLMSSRKCPLPSSSIFEKDNSQPEGLPGQPPASPFPSWPNVGLAIFHWPYFIGGDSLSTAIN
jgi:hypothetical protein